MYKFERTFDNSILDYENTRPTYVKELYDDIFKYKEINTDSNVLEIGIGTGIATLPILEKECQLAAVEPGENLTEFVREKYKNYGNFSLYNQTLQEYESPEGVFDFIYAATAFHWIPEEYGYKRVYELLKNGGAFARFAYHAGKDKSRESLASKMQEIYKTYMNANREPKEYSKEDAQSLAEIAGKYGFEDIDYKLYQLTKDFTADEYMKLLRTYPDHMSLEPMKREMLFHEIYNAINEYGGIITVYYTMDLQLARKR